MKKLLLLITPLFFCATISTAQNIIDEDFLEVIEKNAAPLWQQNAPQFASNVTPAKYDKESAVIIGYKRELSIDKKSKAGFLARGEKSLLFYENIRFKVKLNDRNAVKAFTEFYFRYSDKEDGYSAKIYKNSGVTTTVNLAAAVRLESNDGVPEFFKSFFDQEVNSSTRYFKVALPDLEPGDVLEYVTITKSKLNVMNSGVVQFSPQYELLSKKYPILFNQIAIETDDKSYFKALSKNGAPEFKKETSTNADFFRYVFTDADRPTDKDVNFINAYRQQPFIKFQVIYANKESVKGILIGSKGEIKTGFTKEDLAKRAWEDYTQTGDFYIGSSTVQQYVNSIWSELKKLGAKDWTEKEYVKNVYYRLRNMVLFRDSYLNDQTAAYLFGSLLEEKDIKSDLVITVSNTIVDVKDVLFDNEIRYVIKVGKDYYFNFTDHSNPGDLVESLLDCEGYVITEPAKKTGEQTITPIKLPNASADQNTALYEIDAAINADLNTLTVTRTTTYKGISKNRNIADVLRYTPYMLNDYKNFGGKNPTDGMRSYQEEEYTKMIKTMKERYAEEKPKFVKEEIQRDYGKKATYKNFTLASDGRSPKTADLKFTEEFELQGMVRKAGRKLLINIPGLVGSQLQFKKEERTRNNDIDVGYARALGWKINFKIPDGYTLEGLPELATNINNEIGTYNCTASQANGIATIEIRKIYKQSTFGKAKWNDMLAFVDAAFNTSFKNVLLKPNK
jgi:predicted nucleotidyltransferase